MSLATRLAAAARAFTAAPARGERLRSMPSGAFARAIQDSNPRRRKRVARIPIDYRRYMPPDIENALHVADTSGVLDGYGGAATIAAWVRSNPVVAGITKGRTSIPWRPVGVHYSDAAAAWLEGSRATKGWRTRICPPAELERGSSDRFHCGWQVGLFLWDDELGHPVLQALDPAGCRYLPGEDRWQYYGWGRVFDIPSTPDGIWVFDSLSRNDPWRYGAWHHLGYSNCGAIAASAFRELWQQIFSMPTVLAKSPQGASEAQKAKYTESVIGAALRVIGVTPGYDLDFKQATAEGADTFKQSEDKLERDVAIYTWGTVGLISGGSGFANSDLFEQMKADIIAEEAKRQADFENKWIWPYVLDWAVRAGHLPRGAEQACIEYQTESPAVIQRKAVAAKALMEAGYSAEEAQRRVGLARSAMPELGTTPSSLPSPAPVPEPREEEPEEPGYSEGLAARMTERGLDACPHGEQRACRSCRVVRRFEVQDGEDPYRPVWHAWARRAA